MESSQAAIGITHHHPADHRREFCHVCHRPRRDQRWESVLDVSLEKLVEQAYG